MKETSLIERSTKLSLSKLGDEVVMLSIEQGRYFGLNPVGSEIWEFLEEPKIVTDIVQHLSTKYVVETDTCMHDVLEFLDDMVAKKIVTIAAY